MTESAVDSIKRGRVLTAHVYQTLEIQVTGEWNDTYCGFDDFSDTRCILVIPEIARRMMQDPNLTTSGNDIITICRICEVKMHRYNLYGQRP